MKLFIPVNRGLSDAPLADEPVRGFMRYLRNAIYRPHSQALWKIDGRSKYNPQVSSQLPIKGAGLVRRGAQLANVIMATDGRLFTGGLKETSTLQERGSGYDKDALWTFYSKGTETYGANGVDRPIVYDGITETLGVWGIDPPTKAPNIELYGSGAFGPASYIRYTYTYAKVWQGVIERESDPPFSSGAIVYKEALGPDANYESIRITPFGPLPDWATHYVFYRDFGTGVYLQLGMSTSPFYADNTPNGAEDPGTAIDTSKQVAPICQGMTDYAGKMVVYGIKERLDWIAYSQAGRPFAFPYDDQKVESGHPHLIGLEEAGSQRVYGARRVSKGLLCGLDDGLAFVERLSDESDPLFVDAYSVRQGESVGAVHAEDGFLGPLAWDTLRLYGDEDAVFFPSFLGRGFCMSDGSGASIVSPGLKWTKDVVNENRLDQIVCVNNPRHMRMEIYSSSPDSEYNDQAHFFHYGTGQISRSGAGYPVGKVTGPHPRPVAAAFAAKIAGEKRMFTGCSQTGAKGGRLFIDGGLNDGDNPIDLNLRTVYASFPSRIDEAQIFQVWPVFKGVGEYTYTLTAEIITGEGTRNTVVRTLSGRITDDPGDDEYGDSLVDRDAPRAAGIDVNLTGRLVMIAISNAETGADLGLLGFGVDYAQASGVKANA